MLCKSIGAGTLWEVFPGVSDVQVQISLSGCPTADFCLELLFIHRSDCDFWAGLSATPLVLQVWWWTLNKKQKSFEWCGNIWVFRRPLMCERTVDSTSVSNFRGFKTSSFILRASIRDCYWKSLSVRGADHLYLSVNKTLRLSFWSWSLLDTTSVHNLCWRPSEIQESQTWCWISTNIWNQSGVCTSAHSFLGSPPRSTQVLYWRLYMSKTNRAHGDPS